MLDVVWWRALLERIRRLIDLDYGARANARDALEDIQAAHVTWTTVSPLRPARSTKQRRSRAAQRPPRQRH